MTVTTRAEMDAKRTATLVKVIEGVDMVNGLSRFTDAYDAQGLSDATEGGDLSWATEYKNTVGDLKAVSAAATGVGEYAGVTRRAGPVL